MKTIFFVILLFFECGFSLSAQTERALPDSGEILLKSDLVDSIKVQRLYKLNARRLSSGEFEPVSRISPRIIALSKNLINPKWYGESIRFYAISLERLGQPDSAIKYYTIALEHAKKHGLKKIEGHCYHNIGLAHYMRSSFEDALKAYISAAKIREEIKDTTALGWTLNNIGLIYWRQHSRHDAMVHFRKARDLFKRKKFTEGLAISTSNIGLIDEELNQHDSAIYYYKESYKLNLELENKTGLALNLNNIGGILIMKNEIDSAEKYFQEALAFNLELNNLEGLELNYRNLAEVYKNRKNYPKALGYINKALKISRESNQPQGLIADYRKLSEIYALKGFYKQALEANQQFVRLNDSLNFGDKLATMEARYGKEKNEKEIALLKSENEVNELQLKRKQWFIYSAVIGFIFLAVIIIFVARNNIQRKRVNLSLEQKNNEIIKQKEIIEEKSKDITDSILYAKRIQDAVLPDAAEFEKCFKEHFIIFEPRDIVSGDFYWLAQIENYVILILADCTGHGVPGAFMSIIGHDILNQVVKEEKNFDPSKILSLLDARLYAVLNKKKSGYSTNDGMDISVCCFNTTKQILEYGGAGRPLLVVQDGIFKLVPGNKMSVGGQRMTNEKQFHKEAISYTKSDSFYLMSDGFPDQFGGPKGKKYKSKQLYELLASISSFPLEEQKEKLENVFQKWKGNLEQVDDVCVIGIKAGI